MRKSIIVAAAQNGTIGKNGQLPWRLPDDLKRFKELTMGHYLIMGRKTYESIGRPLPGRITIMLSRAVESKWPHFGSEAGLYVCNSLADAFDFVEDAVQGTTDDEVFICGGGEVYEQALPLIDRVYLTVVERDFEGDTFFQFRQQFPRESYQFIRGVSWKRTSLEYVDGELPHRFEIWERA